jgi:hypothetical protein
VTRIFRTAAIRPTDGTCLPYQAEFDDVARTPRDAAAIRLYRYLLLVTQGPLFDRERLRTIVRLNLHGSTLPRAGLERASHDTR